MGIGSLKQERSGANTRLDAQVAEIRRAVLAWFAVNGRDFPWRQTSDPFHILIAESLLRQTQATRLVKPYTDFLIKYANLQSLAGADIDELHSWFKPLGLIRRADYLVQAAQILVDQYGGEIPGDLKALIKLPGIGIYGARSILCLGFGEPCPMVDEASGRVLRRALDLAVRGPAYSDSKLLRIAETIVPKQYPKEFNLGLIDIAAAYCHTRNSSCPECPLAHLCRHSQRERLHNNVWRHDNGELCQPY